MVIFIPEKKTNIPGMIVYFCRVANQKNKILNFNIKIHSKAFPKFQLLRMSR